MKKIIQINSVVNTGSTGRITEEIGQVILDKGWESYIAYGRYGNPSTSKTIRIGSKKGNYFHVARTRLFDEHGLGSRDGTLKFVKKITNLSPDLIHLHNLHGYYLNLPVFFHYLAGQSIPVVWTLHDCWAFTGHCVHFEEINCEKWKTQCFRCPQTSSYPKSLWTDNSFKNYNLKKELFNSVNNLTVISVSNWLNRLVSKSFLKGSKRVIINNGIDINQFNQNSLTRDEISYKLDLPNKFTILGVASVWGKSKGLHDFIELGKLLQSDEQIILVGLNKSQVKQLPENIIGIERTESIEELVEFYGYADVFVNPTYADTFPTTNLESLATGTPIITYNTGGSIEAVTEETGLVVNTGNISDLINAIRVIKGKGKAFYSRACRERAIKNYNKLDRYGEYIDLYESLMS